MDHKNADILGFLNHKNVLDIFKKTSIAVACSRWEEPFGRTSLEASANGCAVIITNKGGLPETITNAKILKKLSNKNLERTLKELINNTISTVETKNITQVGMRLLKFCAKWDMQRIADQAAQYAQPLQARYKND